MGAVAAKCLDPGPQRMCPNATFNENTSTECDEKHSEPQQYPKSFLLLSKELESAKNEVKAIQTQIASTNATETERHRELVGQLQKSSERYHQLVDSMMDSVAVMDAERKALSAENEALRGELRAATESPPEVDSLDVDPLDVDSPDVDSPQTAEDRVGSMLHSAVSQPTVDLKAIVLHKYATNNYKVDELVPTPIITPYIDSEFESDVESSMAEADKAQIAALREEMEMERKIKSMTPVLTESAPSMLIKGIDSVDNAFSKGQLIREKEEMQHEMESLLLQTRNSTMRNSMEFESR